MVFEDCQVEADESVIRKEKVYGKNADGSKRRTATILSQHHRPDTKRLNEAGLVCMRADKRACQRNREALATTASDGRTVA